MDTPHEDAVLNFDLDFLHPTTNNIPVHTLKQRYISQVKKRIIRVDAINKYCSSLKLDLGNKNKELELTKKKLASTTQEYTQTSLEYKEALENFSKCEQDCQSLQYKLKDFQDKYYEAVNNVDAGKSHVVQLQQLVIQHEKKIELLQKNETNKTDKAIKERFERELQLCKKTHKKDVDDWQNKYNKLLKELQETKLSNEKLQEQLSAKNYELNNEIAHDFISHDEHSENEDDMSDDIRNQDLSQIKVDVSQRCSITKKDMIMMDSDFKNDIVSVDTGCGSSLASSLNSPDFILSPINGESFEINRGRQLVSTATSPILMVKMIDTATSPAPAVKMVNVGTSPIKKINKTYKDFGTQTESAKPNNTPVRPISPDRDIPNIIVSSPVSTIETLSEVDMLEDTNNQEQNVITNVPHIEIEESQEKQCLELNNSNNMNKDPTSDNEVVMILNTMRFNHKLITPIPKSPKKPVPVDVRHSVCQEAAIARDQAASAKHEAATARHDAAKTREESKKMMVTVASLMKDVFHMKRFLKNSFTNAESALELNDSPLSYDLLQNLTDDDSTNEASNPPNIELDKPIVIESHHTPVCSSDSQIEITLGRILGTEPIENSIVTQEENRMLRNTMENENRVLLNTPENKNRVLPNTPENENRVLPNTPENENRVLQDMLEKENCNDQNIFSEEDNAMCLDKSLEVQSESPTEILKKRGVKKITKLSYLGKYRKKCELRKYKIRGTTPPLRKSRMKPKPLIRKPIKSIVKLSDTSITLNNKDVYAKAVKVMAELNAKSSKKSTKPVINARSEPIINTVKNHHNDLHSDNTFANLNSPETTTISVKPASISQKFSASSPKSDALLRSPIKTNSTAVTSPTTDIIVLRRSRRSSVLAATCSPTSPIKSPSPSRKLSDVCTALSPILVITPLTPESKSPKNCIATPSTTSSTTKARRRSLRFSSNSPIKSVEACTPTATRRSLRFSSNTSTNSVEACTPTVPTTTESVEACTPNASTRSRRFSSNTPIKSVEACTPTGPTTTKSVEACTPTATRRSLRISSNTSIKSIEACTPTATRRSLRFSSNTSTNSVEAVPTTTKSVEVCTPTASTHSLRFSSNTSIKSVEACTPTVPTTTKSVEVCTPTASTRSLRFSSNTSIKSVEACIATVPTITTKAMTIPSASIITTRSQVQSARVSTDQRIVELSKDTEIDKVSVETIDRKRKLSNSSDTQSKRVLRSTQAFNSFTEEYTTHKVGTIDQPASIEVFALEEDTSWNPKESILCFMIQKYGKKTVGPFTKNVPDAVLKSVSNKIERFMLKIKDNTCVKDNNTMHELVQELQKCNYKNFVSGLMKYLTNPDRKMELFGKSSSPPAPQMTRYEAVMLYVIRQLRSYWRPVDIVDVILSSIEHTLFKLNRTPDFDVVESVSHFYALVCRYFGQHSRLKVFMLDAMYCILFKSVPLIKQCLEVHPHIIPLSHMSAAKTSLVTIFVYLLHFYKCDDKFNRVQEIRNILVKRYYYQITEWNETKILELVGSSILELKDISNEQKMLRIAIIILGKRHGAKWTQNNIVKKLLQIIDKEKTIPEHVTEFCVLLIGPLMKPYPADMKVHCELALNKLVNIMNTTNSQRIEEAAINSMIIMGRHNYNRVNEILFSRKMKAMSPELEETIRDYIRMRPLSIWKRNLPKISLPT